MTEIRPVIHHHFQIAPEFLLNPGIFDGVRFTSTPWFKLYPLGAEDILRRTISALGNAPTSKAEEHILKSLRPFDKEVTHWRADLIAMRRCIYNRQRFCVRVYKFLCKDFLKVEITLHAGFLGDGKYLNLEEAYESACRIFSRFEQEGLIPLDPLGRHKDEYWFYEDFRSVVSVWDKELIALKQAKNEITKCSIKEGLRVAIVEFQEKCIDLAAERLRDIKTVIARDAYFDSPRELSSEDKAEPEFSESTGHLLTITENASK